MEFQSICLSPFDSLSGLYYPIIITSEGILRLSNLLGAIFVVSFCVWAGADWGAKPAMADICAEQKVQLENCEGYQTAFVVSSVSGYTASTTAGIWFVITQLLGINPVIWKTEETDAREED